jgi:hypothetical protein
MKLEVFLEELKTCPDDRLSAAGIGDNWPIFLKEDFQRVLNHFIQSDQYKLYREIVLDNKRHFIFDYIPGTVQLQVLDWRALWYTTTDISEKDVEARIHENRQTVYNITIMLHPYYEKKMERVHMNRALAIVIEDIAEFTIKNKIPICFPKFYDHSEIVYSSD